MFISAKRESLEASSRSHCPLLGDTIMECQNKKAAAGGIPDKTENSLRLSGIATIPTTTHYPCPPSPLVLGLADYKNLQIENSITRVMVRLHDAKQLSRVTEFSVCIEQPLFFFLHNHPLIIA